MQSKQRKGESLNSHKRSSRPKRRPNPKAPRKLPRQVGVASYARSPSSHVGMKSETGFRCSVKGTDFVSAVTAYSTTVAGTPLLTVDISPMSIGVSRLSTLSGLYERYRYKRLTFRYCPTAPSTTAGQLIGYIDRDVKDQLSTPDVNLRRAFAHYGEKPVQVWQGGEKPVSWTFSTDSKSPDLYTSQSSAFSGESDHWTSGGRFVLLAATSFSGTTPCGNIFVDYDVDFSYPQLENTPIAMKVAMLSSTNSATAGMSDVNSFPPSTTVLDNNSNLKIYSDDSVGDVVIPEIGYYVGIFAWSYVTGSVGSMVSAVRDASLLYETPIFFSNSGEAYTAIFFSFFATKPNALISCINTNGEYGPASKKCLQVFSAPPAFPLFVFNLGSSKDKKTVASASGSSSTSSSSSSTSSATSSVVPATPNNSPQVRPLNGWFKV